MYDQETPEQKAIRLFRRQLEELDALSGLHHQHAHFKAWRDTTAQIFEKFLGKEDRLSKRFLDLKFCKPARMVPYGFPTDYISREDTEAFRSACETTEATLKAAIRYIEDFGPYVEQPKSTSKSSGGVSQNFHGPVNIHSFAIAADSAIQSIGQMGDNTGASLKEIAELLRQSEELSPRQVKEGLAHIEALAIEVAKPEVKRDWKTVLERGGAILDLTNKATDLASKLAAYTPAILALVDHAKHYI